MKLSLALPDPLWVDLELAGTDGAKVVQAYIIQPATRGQVKEALAFDLEDSENLNLADLEAARGLQVEILARESGLVISKEDEPLKVDWSTKLPCERLSGEQSTELCTAILHHHLGQDPAMAIALRRVVKKNAIVQRWIAANASTPRPSQSLHTSESLRPQPSVSGT